MAGYLAWRIEIGKLDYYTIFSAEFFKPYKEETDSILKEEGYEHLIVPVT